MKRGETTPAGPQPGDVLLFGTALVVLHERQGSRARVLTMDGATKGVRTSDLDGPFGLTLDTAGSRDDVRRRMADLERTVTERQGEVAIADLWELLQDDATEQTPAALAEAWFGEATPEGACAVVRAHAVDPHYFAKRNLLFQPKPAAKVEATLRNVEALRQKERVHAEAVRWFSDFLVGRSEPPPPAELEPLVQRLREAAIDGRGTEGADDLAALLDALSLDHDEGPFELLVRLGVFHEDENLLLLQHRVPRVFPADVLRLADDLATTPSTGDGNREVVPVPAVTIDDADTKERDDALSVQPRDGGGWTIGIHITDVAALLPRDSPLDAEAQRRAVTLYLPEGSITMLPEALAHGPLSLEPGTTRRAVSVFVDVDETMTVRATRLARTVVTLEAALTYDAALATLDTDQRLRVLDRLAKAHAARRIEAGARPPIEGAELKVRVVDGEVELKRLDRTCPARTMVSELMVLANCTVAATLAEARVPCIYRTQEPAKLEADSVVERLALPAVPKVQVSTVPRHHATLGVQCYTQSTSPLRRYGDLLVQRQLAAFLEGDTPPYTEAELAYLVEATDMAATTVRTVERWSNRYWLVKYLHQRVGETLRAVVIDRRRDGCVVELSDYLLTTRLFPSPTSTYAPGDVIGVQLVSVHPRRGQIRVEEALAH